MRLFNGSRLRTLGELLLAMVILSVLIYDLTVPSSAPVSDDTSGLEWKSQVEDHLGTEEPSSSSASSSSSSSARLSQRFRVQVDPTINPGNTTTICSNTTFATNPVVVGNVPILQAMVISLGGAPGCSVNPYLLYPGSPSGLASVTVNPGSWISFKALSASGGAVMDTLTMQPGSFFEVDAGGYTGNTANILRTVGPCPSFAGVNTVISNCPGACSLAMTSLAPSGCQIGYTVTGVTPVLSTVAGLIVMNKDCGSYTQAQFLSDVSAATGIPASNIKITSWLCASITATFQVLGANVASANAGVQQIINSANSGSLKTTLNVLSASVIDVPTTTTTTYYYYPTTTTFPIESSSNPALFALLTLLAIPLLAALGLLWWCCMKKKDEPAPAPPPPPPPPPPPAPKPPVVEAPVVYYPPEPEPVYVAPEPEYTYLVHEPTMVAQPYGYETAAYETGGYTTPVGYGYDATAYGGNQVIVPVPVATSGAEYATTPTVIAGTTTPGMYSAGSVTPPAYT